MFSRLVSRDEAAFLLDLERADELDLAIAQGLISAAGKGPKGGPRFRVSDLVMLRLAETMKGIGVDQDKALRYSEAVLAQRMVAHNRTVFDWIENEAQELYCLIADHQLARIFLRNKEDRKEMDVGAIKPVLFPTTMCEINVFRVIRPVIVKARRLLGGE
jgi:hypothetical protein